MESRTPQVHQHKGYIRTKIQESHMSLIYLIAVEKETNMAQKETKCNNLLIHILNRHGAFAQLL